MHSDAVRCQGLHCLHGGLYILQSFLRQSDDEIHIDVVKANLTGKLETVHHILHCVAASDETQSILLHSLWVDGNTAHAMFLKHLQLLPGDAVRTSCFHGKLLNGREIKGPL